MTALDDLKELRTELAEAIRSADARELAGHRLSLSASEKSERIRILAKIDADILKFEHPPIRRG